jgi:hypothetical protein
MGQIDEMKREFERIGSVTARDAWGVAVITLQLRMIQNYPKELEGIRRGQ